MTTRRLSRAPEHVSRHSFAEHGLIFQHLPACCVERYTPTGTQSTEEIGTFFDDLARRVVHDDGRHSSTQTYLQLLPLAS